MRLPKRCISYFHVLAAVVWLLVNSSTTASVQDTLRINADSVHLKLENDRVRVLDSILPPGGKEKMHSHPSYVVYVIRGGKIRIHGADGQTSETDLKVGDVISRARYTLGREHRYHRNR